MSTVLDQTLDLNGQELHRLASVYPLPDFVKDASQLDVCGDQETPPHMYADTTHRLYPVHTPAATVVSALFFLEKKASMAVTRRKMIEERLGRAAVYHKVLPAIEQLAEKVAAAAVYDDTQLPDSDFAIVFTAKDGTKERHYSMRNPGEVKRAAEWLAMNRDKLPFDDRRKVADKILEKGAQYGVALGENLYMLEKTAGVGACSGKHAAGLIRSRIRALGHTHKPNELQQELDKLAQLCESAPEAIQHFAVLTKIASVIDQFDREHGLVGKYDDRLERPEDVLFAVTEKAAADLDHELVGSVLTGNYYKRADLQSVPVRDLVDAMGQDFADAVTKAGTWLDIEKLAAIVPTLPLGDAEQFDEVVAAAGVRPFAVKSASVGRSITVDAQMELAAKHKPHAGSLWDKVR